MAISTTQVTIRKQPLQSVVRDEQIRDHCGVVAVRGPNSIELSHSALKLLQHRGQESAGITWLNRGRLVTAKGMGLVDQAVNKDRLPTMTRSAIGHVRYSTTGNSSIDEAQPMGTQKVSIAFNGTVTNYRELIPGLGHLKTSTDTEVVVKYIDRELRRGASPKKAIVSFMGAADGAYSLVAIFENGTMIAVRDPKGFRPLARGMVGPNMVVASEDSAIRQLGGTETADIKAGELYIVNGHKPRIYLAIDDRNIHTCSFEYGYLARPDSNIDGVNVYMARVRMGELLAQYHGVDADVVIPVPETGRHFAVGYSRASKIPYDEGLYTIRPSMRSFIMPRQQLREEIVKSKFGIVGEIVNGKRIILVDDSIVRGTTMVKLVAGLRDAGAREVHVRIGTPPIPYVCQMGVDFPVEDDLVANGANGKGVAGAIGADSLAHITVEEMKKGIGREDLCTACFTGEYPLKEQTIKAIGLKVVARV